MAQSPNPKGEESTYFIKESGAEAARLVEQERLFAKALGGLFPEQADEGGFLAPLERILDVACGSGEWALEVAHAYPHLQVAGFDIDARMIGYALARAEAGKLDNATFRVMDARQPLEYLDGSFDLVNGRYLVTIPAVAWPSMMQELYRITKPGGVIRVTESENVSVSNSEAFEQLSHMFLQALKQAGMGFSPDGHGEGTTVMLARFLKTVGCQNIQRKPFVIDWSAGTDAHEPIFENLRVAFPLVKPFLIQMGITTAEVFDQVYRQAEIEMMSDAFCALWTFLTVWGYKPLSPAEPA